jgi:hypothetical protein
MQPITFLDGSRSGRDSPKGNSGWFAVGGDTKAITAVRLDTRYGKAEQQSGCALLRERSRLFVLFVFGKI